MFIFNQDWLQDLKGHLYFRFKYNLHLREYNQLLLKFSAEIAFVF